MQCNAVTTAHDRAAARRSKAFCDMKYAFCVLCCVLCVVDKLTDFLVLVCFSNFFFPQENARLLAGLIRASQKVIKPYAATMLAALLPKLKYSSPSVSSAVLVVCIHA